MTKLRFPCKYHPEKLSAKKCFLCKEYICNSCAVHFAHHIFCSNWCIIKYFFKNNSNIIKNGLRLKRIKIFTAAVIIIVLLQFIFYFSLNNKIKNLDLNVKQLQSEDSITEFAQFDSSQIAFTLDTSFTPASNFMNISGKAVNNALVGLWQNGKFVQSQIVDKEYYTFSPQALSLGKNHFALWVLVNGRASLIDSFTVDYHSYRLQLLAISVYRMNTEKKILALTFDAGSHSFGADSIFRILQDKGVKSTFFLTGNFIKKYPLVVKKMITNGHEQANHTYTHPHLTSLELNGQQNTLAHVDRKFIYNQLNKTDSVFYDYFHLHLKPYWRAPFGELNKEILAWAAEIGYRHIHWSSGCDTWDWVCDKQSPLYRTPQDMYNHLLKLELEGKLNGAIILMHLCTDRTSEFPFHMLTKLIDSLHEKGYRFMTISQLLGMTLSK
jgi:peptidoglycan/xylan/chitin deacetylase (PgdA/CDA1 family)